MVRIAISLHPQQADYADFRRAAVEAERMGVDVIYTWDHFYPLYGDADGKHFECFALLAALAEVTERCPIGPLVACNSYRNPELLADMSRTIDHICGGRMILGIGSGWAERDYDEYGYDFGTARSRLDDLAAALPRIESRLSRLNPAPLGRLPILIGGAGEKVTLRLVAEHAHIWHGFASADSGRDEVGHVRHKMEVLEQWCEKVGRDPGAIERSIGVDGSRLDLADPIADLGVQEITIGAGGPDYDLTALARWIEWRDRRG